MSMSERRQNLFPVLDHWIERWCERNRVPGCAVGIVDDGKVQLLQNVGMANAQAGELVGDNTRFRLASISKTFTALALMQLVQAGRVSLDDPVSRHLPWLTSLADERLRRITVRQLATHTAGLAREGRIRFAGDGRQWPSAAQARDALADAVVVEPGTRLLYSNYGFYLLGALIEQVGGTSLAEVLRKNVLHPLGMFDTAFEDDADAFTNLATGYLRQDSDGFRAAAPVEDLAAFSAAGGMVSTASDMCRYLDFWVNGNEAVLSNDVRREMIRTHWYEPDGSVRWAIGLEHWNVANRDVIGHGGLLLGFALRIAFDVERRRGFVALTNGMDAPTMAMMQTVLTALETVDDANLGDGAEDKSAADRFCGRFGDAWGQYVIARLGSSLVGIGLDSEEPMVRPDVLAIHGENELFIVDGHSGGHVGQTIMFDFAGSGVPKTVHYGSYLRHWIGPIGKS